MSIAVGEADARRILLDYAQFPDLARELRFWLSSQSAAASNAPEDRRDALQVKALLERELSR